MAIVTGAGSGIGRVTAEVFAEQGAHVVVADWNAATGEETAARIMDAGHDARFQYVDVSQAPEVQRMVQFTVEQYGRLDVLVNNAAVQIFGTVTETSEEDWDRLLSVNLKGVFLCSKYAIPEMIRGGGGSVVTWRRCGICRRPGPGSLLRRQGRHDRSHQGDRHRIRPQPGARQLHLPRRREHPDGAGLFQPSPGPRASPSDHKRHTRYVALPSRGRSRRRRHSWLRMRPRL